MAPPQPPIALLLATWDTLKREPHSSTIDLFVCEFKNYEPLIAGSAPISLSLIVGRSKYDEEASVTRRIIIFLPEEVP